MNRKQEEDFSNRKDFFRKKHMENKSQSKKLSKNFDDDFPSKKINKANKKRLEQIRQEELWEDWEGLDE